MNLIYYSFNSFIQLLFAVLVEKATILLFIYFK